MKDIIRFLDCAISPDTSVTPDEQTVWLSADQMASLSERDRSVVQRHISSIYGSKELDKNGTCAKNAQVAPNVETYSVPFYNLDIVLSARERIGNNLRTSLKKII